MKNLRYIIPAIALLIFTACDSNDDGFYNTKYLKATNLVTIETTPSYAVNDLLYVNANIPNLLSEPGQSTPLNVLKTTNAQSFTFSYVIEKMNGSQWELVNVSDNFVLNDGGINLGSFLQAFLEYDGGQEAYTFRGGIRLAQSGQYRLSFGYNSSNPNEVELASQSSNNNIKLNISSTTNSLDGSGYYNFTVQ